MPRVPAIPIRPQYGPTLGRVLSPRWRAAGPLVRAAALAAPLALGAVAIAAALALLNAHFSTGGVVPFGFSYRSLYRTTPDPGSIVKVRRLDAHGRLEDSFAVGPLLLPPYSGDPEGELPAYASRYIAGLERRYGDFTLYGEGYSRINLAPAYDVYYTASIAGHPMMGRDVLLVAHRPGVRHGVAITILTTATADRSITSPQEVATDGVLLRPYKTFTLR